MTTPDAPTDDLQAPDGYLWVCLACGKTNTHRYPGWGEGSLGWDESCMLNARLFATDRIVFEGARVVRILKEEVS